MTKEKKSSSNPVPVVESVIDLEKKPVTGVVYTFQILSYVFMAAAITAAVLWFYYTAKWVDKVYNDDNVYSFEVGEDDGSGLDTVNTDRKAMFTFQIITLCFQILVASALIYFVFRHHYKHH